MSRSCAQCGRSVRDGARFCGACGAALPDASLAAGQPAPIASPAVPQAPGGSPLTPPPPQPTPPPEVADFVGRTTELSYFKQKLAREHLAVITGLPGMGKTALAAALARQAASSPLIFWHAFHRDEGIDVVTWELAAFLAWHGHADLWLMLQGAQRSSGQLPPPAVLFDYLVQAIRGRGFLLCFDDFQFVEDDPLLEQLVSRVRAEVRSGQMSLIITSRRMPEFAVAADGPGAKGCGAPGRQVTFEVGGQAIGKIAWDNNQLQQVDLVGGGSQ